MTQTGTLHNHNRCYRGFAKSNAFWSHRPILEFERILKQIYTYGNIHFEIPTVGRSTRMHYLYQNLDSIYWWNASSTQWRM